MSVIRIGTRIIDLRPAVGRGAGGGDAYGPEAFVTEWTVSTGDTIILPHYDGSVAGGSTLNYDVDWGDGNSDSGVTTVDKTHTYTFSGGGTKTFQVVITGSLLALNMYRASTTQQGYLTKMVQWGTDVEWSSLYRMFYKCIEMTYEATDFPDISNLAEQSSIYSMFYNCEKVTSLDLSNWTNTDSITNMSYCVYTHSSSSSTLATLNLTGWDTSNVTTFSNAFNRTGDPTTGCDFIMPNLDVSSSTTFANAFQNTKIKSINIVGWTLRAAGVSLSNMFNGAIEGTVGTNFSIAATGWTNTDAITTLSRFIYASGVTSIDLTGWDTSDVTDFYGTFYSNSNLTHITGLSGFDSSSATTMASMFKNSKILNFGAGATTNLGSNFANSGSCSNFQSVFEAVGDTTPGTAAPNVANWNVSAATTMASMFKDCEWTGGSSIDTSAWEIPATCTSLSLFAKGCSTAIIDFSDANCDLSGVTTMNQFAYLATNLTRFILNATLAKPGFTSVTLLNNAFNGETLVTGDYDELLLKLDAGGQSSVTLHGGGSKYSAGAAATARANLVTKSWTITDGGPA